MPVMVVGDMNEDIDRNILSCQLSMQGWRRPHYETKEGVAVSHTYRCGAVESSIDAIYLSPAAFPSIHHVCARTLEGQRGLLQHDLLSVEVQLSDSESVQRPPQSVCFTTGPKYHQHSPVDWSEETNVLNRRLGKVGSDYNSGAFTSWSQDLDDAWNHFQRRLYQHILACHVIDVEKHAPEFCPPSVEEFVTSQPAITTTSPPKKSKRTGPMRMRANIYKLIDLANHPDHARVRKSLVEEREFICESLMMEKETFQEHLRNPEPAIQLWREANARYIDRFRERGIRKWRRSLTDAAGRITRKCYNWLRRDLLQNHFALWDGVALRTGARDFFAQSRSYWCKLMNRSTDERQSAFLYVHREATESYQQLDLGHPSKDNGHRDFG
eukprot:2433124-Amphidinium_carterae.1